MIRLIIERWLLWGALKKYGNPFKHPFWIIMLCSLPFRVRGGYVYFFNYGGGEYHIHVAVSRFSMSVEVDGWRAIKALDPKKIVVYDNCAPVIKRICVRNGAILVGNKYILEFDNGRDQSF